MNEENFFDGNNEQKKQKYSRRKPYVEISIDQINENGKYCVFGSVISVSEQSFEITDERGVLKVIKSPEVSSINLEEGMQVRVFGYVETEPEKKMAAVIIQDFSEVDANLYLQMKEFEKLVKE
ncbi:MAG: hypothetical protein ACTSQE_04565 [Candidatus Heimdallarchaeaceae archaeon]